MTPEQLKAKFPNASADFIAANSRTPAALESNSGDAPLAPRQVQKGRARKILVSVTSYRRKLADPDGLCEKYFLDCCKYAGFIPDDSPTEIELVTKQKKVSKGEPEETVIELFELD